MQGSLTERITRSLAYMLRHQPEEFDLELDKYGYAGLPDVTCALNERLGEPIEESDVEDAITSGNRPRYEIVKGRIRALYGHSVEIDPGEPSSPPELLYVGVGSRDAERAGEHGLNGGRRSFLHLALDYDDARESGRRIAGRYAVVTVYAQQAHGEGVHFYDRKALFLAEEIPTEYLEVGEIHDDGIERERGFGGRSPRGRSGGPGRGGRDRDRAPRGEGRGGRGGRGDERPERSRDERPERSRDERPERSRNERPERSRDERPERSREGRPARGRDERPARSNPQPERRAPEPASQPSPARQPASKSSGGGFGSGIFGGEKKASRPEPTGPAPARAEPKKAKPPEPEQPARKQENSGFGDGLF